MLIHDDVFEWDGWGGQLNLCSGQCRLRIFNLKDQKDNGLTPLKPYMVLTSELAGKKNPRSWVTMRSMAGHIATLICEKWNIDPQRMVYIEYYPGTSYGSEEEHHVSERMESAIFEWHENRAMNPVWHPLKSPLLEWLKEAIQEN
jgi:hypothetical protein